MMRLTNRCTLFMASLLMAATVAAQSYPPGARPPVMPASSVPSLHPLGVPGLAPVAMPTAGGGAGFDPSPAVPPAGPAHRVNRPKGMVPPPPPLLVLQSGVNATMGIAYAHTNRLVTPFEHPEVKTNSTAAITVEGPIVYVSTNMDDPISMFVHDHDRGDPAISVTLVPEEIPAVSTQIRMSGMDAVADVGGAGMGAGSLRAPAPASNEVAHAFETSNPYVETLVALMKDLAHERVPEGYSLEVVRGYTPLMPACVMPGLRVEPAQVLSGANYEVIVARATNPGFGDVAVREDGCGEAVRAVAAWPERVVHAGGSTELYLVLARPNEEEHSGVRPAVAGAR